ncbi:oligoendopeptidase F [Propionispira arboris]|uniref:Oligopeptidase F n=1 Tax=Propionispira arboris TaxID=84035 RepID=A0A1H6XDI8_9FIRM|nr:oligoendopeptidase F [Propionispira arboris]SEJ25564.1 oligoendopeptidase F [Propionispira arboris]
MNLLYKLSNRMNLSATDTTSAATVATRDKIEAKFKWSLHDIYPNDQAFQADYEKLKEQILHFEVFKGKLNNANDLLQCFRLRDEVDIKLSSLFAYARMNRDTDATNAAYQAMTAQITTLLSDDASAQAFIEPELLALPAETLLTLIESKPELSAYSFYIKNMLRQKSHILSPIEEELLAKTSELRQAAMNIFTIFTNADLKFPETITESGQKAPLTEGRYNQLIRSTNREVRHDAFKNLFNTYSSFRNTLATTYSANINSTMFQAKTRKYQSTLEAALDNNNIPASVYTNVIDTIHKNFAQMHRYVALKKKVLQLDQIHMYDLYTPIVPELKTVFPYEDGLSLVIDSLQPLGQTYIKDLLNGVNNGWIDIYENQGKRNGAYSWGVYGLHPFVLLNYDDSYNAVSTLAHELGHAMHSFYSSQKQDYINSEYTIFCAEVASTTNENLLLDHMLHIVKEPEKRIYFINQYLEQVRTTVYRQALFAEFEKIAHAKAEIGEALTADALETIWTALNTAYYGNDIVIDPELKIEWARIPHFYRPFYVYQYATGYAAATTLAEQLQTEGPIAQKRYLQYLQSGGSDYSINLLRQAGVNMTTPKPLEITLEKFSKRLDELEVFLLK